MVHVVALLCHREREQRVPASAPTAISLQALFAALDTYTVILTLLALLRISNGHRISSTQVHLHWIHEIV